MRKIYLTLALIIGFGWAMAQNQVSVVKKEKEQLSQNEMAKISQSILKYRADRAATSKVIKSRWYGYGFELNTQLGGIADVSANNLWPDSTILVNYGSSGYSGTWLHSLGEALNPMSSIFNSSTELNINSVMPYTIDSVGFYCWYYREAATASAVDTLIITILEDGDGNYYWEQGGNPWVMSDFGTDTLWFKGIKHDALVNYSTDPMYTTYKLPLTAGMENDTLSNGVNYFKVPINKQIAAGQTFVATVRFAPGFSWTANSDTISSVNHLRFLSYEENGEAGGAGTLPSYTKFDWNCSYILHSTWMYNPTSTVYAPSYAFTAPFSYEHHWIEFLLTANENGIANAKSNNLSVNQNQPNPFSNNTTITYTLDQRADVNLTVYNVAGAKVLEMNEGSKNAGSHQILLSADNLNSGVYYYTVSAGANQITKKMIVY